MGGSRAFWITRAEPGASETAEHLRELGLTPVVEPLLEVRFLERSPLDLAGVSLVVFTSANGVRAFAARTDDRRMRTLTVGDATAAAARAAGFGEVESAGGDLEAVAAALRRMAPGGVVLYAAPSEPAGDLPELLEGSGVELRRVTLYETVPREPSPDFILRLAELDGVMVYSPRAGRLLAGFLEHHPAEQLAAFCLSENVAAALADTPLVRRAVAPSPTEAALIGLIAG